MFGRKFAKRVSLLFHYILYFSIEEPFQPYQNFIDWEKLITTTNITNTKVIHLIILFILQLWEIDHILLMFICKPFRKL